MLYLHHFTDEVGVIIKPILQIGEVMNREVKYILQGYTTNKWQRRNSNPGNLTSESRLLNTTNIMQPLYDL